eukprot:1235180-Rhodomonas_salina.1
MMNLHRTSVRAFTASAGSTVETRMALLRFAIEGYFTVLYQGASEILEFRLRSLVSGDSVAVARFLVPLGCKE